MNRVFTLLYGVFAYFIFFGVFLYLVGFVANFLVPKGVDSGEAPGLVTALAIDVALIALFGLQHSLMARSGFKQWWTRIVPHAIERSTYVMATNVVLILMFWLWQPIPQTVWHVETPELRIALWALFATGLGISLASTFMVDHFDLFGLRQVWFAFRARTYSHPEFVVRWFYRLVRHPLYTGMFMMFWATPDMTLGHALFSAGMTFYVLVAVRFEERDLVKVLGSDYVRYKSEVPMFLPKPGQVHAPIVTTHKAPSGMR